MTSEMLTCPYCNAAIDAPPGLAAGQRIACPRCGDTFALRQPSAAIQAAPQVVGVVANLPPDRAGWQPVPRARWSNRLIAAVVLGVMALMAGGGLTLALLTQQQRRAHDAGLPPRPKRSPVPVEPEDVAIAPIAPDRLAALGYLPKGTNLILAVRVAELLANPTGQRLLHDPIKVGDNEYPLSELPAWLGLRLEDVDHFAFGLRLDDTLLPPIYLVVRTVQPIDADKLREALKATRVASAVKKTVYSFRTPRHDLTLAIWFADDHQTLVAALTADQLERVPDHPEEDLRQLPDELRGVLKERREPVGPVWLAGHSPDWTKTSAVRFLNRLKKDDLQRLGQVQTFGVWIQVDAALTVKAVFRCKDARGARRLEEYFHPPRAEGKGTLKTALDGPWLNMQWQTEPDLISRIWKR